MQKKETPRISFGIIVLNGEPFTRYCLRSLYPFAHEIIIVEGACPGAKNYSTEDGHSSDGTLEVLRDFKEKEDPDNKVRLITAEDEGHPNGFWPGEKDEMSQAYAKRISGDYLWQVDVDEFYHEKDMPVVLRFLSENPDVYQVSFFQTTFWGHLKYYVDGWIFRDPSARFWAQRYHRLFKWEKGSRCVSHRPPTMCDAAGVSFQEKGWERGDHLKAAGVFLYHYSLLFPKQVKEKCEYYKEATWSKRMGATQWYEKVYQKLEKPFRVHNLYMHFSWLCRFAGEHPAQVQAMMSDIESGKLSVELRAVTDVERLLRSPLYFLGVSALKCRFKLRELILWLVRISRGALRRLASLSYGKN